MFMERYSSPSELNQEFTGSRLVGLCGLGTKSCYDLVVFPDGSTESETQGQEVNTLFQELKSGNPDFHADLLKLSKEMNQVFREKAGKLLEKFIDANPKIRGHVHLAAIGSPEGLYLAYATKLPPDELFRRGATLAKSKLAQFADALLNPPATATGAKKTKKADE
jgi:hypothetical protein